MRLGSFPVLLMFMAACTLAAAQETSTIDQARGSVLPTGKARPSGRRYGVLKGKPVAAAQERHDSRSPHYQILLMAGGASFRIAVNVKSQQKPSDLMYWVDTDFRHPVTSGLESLPEGFSDLNSRDGGLALDYVRGNLFDRTKMRLLPHDVHGPDNDLTDVIDHYTRRAIELPEAQLYVFGDRWGPDENDKDKVFGFLPGNGVHDVHMNQGSLGRFSQFNGVWQDGGLLIRFPGEKRWVGIFLAFQSQSWLTDDVTGHAVQPPSGGSSRGAEDRRSVEPDVRIIAAMINPRGPSPEQESVTLINTSTGDLNLTGWALADRNGNRLLLKDMISAGATRVVSLPSYVQLGNRGGTLTLFSPQGLRVHGVSYTLEQAAREGRTVVF